MAFSDFTNGTWKVLSTPSPNNEAPGHQITIRGVPSAVIVACSDNPTGHNWPTGVYSEQDDSNGRIYFPNGVAPIWWVNYANPPRQIRQSFPSGGADPDYTGSWTAEDSGRKPDKHGKH